MLEAFSEIAPGAQATADALAPFAPSGVLVAVVWLAKGLLSPVLEPAKQAAEAFRDYFDGLAEYEKAEADHREAELAHWKAEEGLLAQIAGAHILPSEGLKVLGQ